MNERVPVEVKAPDVTKIPNYCSLRTSPPKAYSANVSDQRLSLIELLSNKWVNGTTLHYYFFDKETDAETVRSSDGSTRRVSWLGDETQKQMVRDSFKAWKDLGIGLKFEEVRSREKAEIRIGFMQGDGSWSYIGRDILTVEKNERTMNIGWDLRRQPDTAIHEIGHSLGFPHEHQNPNAGIEWDEDAVYAALAGSPNFWSREKTFQNIIQKIQPDLVKGSTWDPDSVMEYPFEAGLIKRPLNFRENGIHPPGGLSARDKEWALSFYPSMNAKATVDLEPMNMRELAIGPGEQQDFVIRPEESRTYDIRTFGSSDAVIVLFENEAGNKQYLAGSDDSGQDENASLKIKLLQGREYVLSVRMHWRPKSEKVSLMLW